MADVLPFRTRQTPTADDVDQEVVDRERAAQITRMADAAIEKLDRERFADMEDAEAAINRQLADLERETSEF